MLLTGSSGRPATLDFRDMGAPFAPSGCASAREMAGLMYLGLLERIVFAPTATYQKSHMFREFLFHNFFGASPSPSWAQAWAWAGPSPSLARRAWALAEPKATPAQFQAQAKPRQGRAQSGRAPCQTGPRLARDWPRAGPGL